MSNYGKTEAGFWIGETGVSLRGNLEAQVIAHYLISCPMAKPTGLYYLPIPIVTFETGCSFEGALKGLRSLEQVGFAIYNNEKQHVYVKTMAIRQFGDRIDPKDKRHKFIVNLLKDMNKSPLFMNFYNDYREAYSLPALEKFGIETKGLGRGFEGASKGDRSPIEANSIYSNSIKNKKPLKSPFTPAAEVSSERSSSDNSDRASKLEHEQLGHPRVDALEENEKELHNSAATPRVLEEQGSENQGDSEIQDEIESDSIESGPDVLAQESSPEEAGREHGNLDSEYYEQTDLDMTEDSTQHVFSSTDAVGSEEEVSSEHEEAERDHEHDSHKSGKGTKKQRGLRVVKTLIPEDFTISPSVRAWAKEKGHNRLEERLEHFIGYANANGARYANWDQAFMNAIRADWAKLNRFVGGHYSKPAQKPVAANRAPEQVPDEDATSAPTGPCPQHIAERLNRLKFGFGGGAK